MTSRLLGSGTGISSRSGFRRRCRFRGPAATLVRGLLFLALTGAGLAPQAVWAAAAGAGASPKAAATSGQAAAPAAAVVAPGTLYLRGIDCIPGSSSTTCVAVGANSSNIGVVVPISSGVPGTPIPAPMTATLNGVFCASATTCLAVGTNAAAQGVVLTVSSGSVGVPQLVMGTSALNAVSCNSATSCVAVGTNTASQGVVAPITNGTPGAAQVVSATAALNGVFCVNATVCEAVGSNASSQGAVVAITNVVPGTVQVSSDTKVLFAISCSTATSCVAVGYNSALQGVAVTVSSGTPAVAQVASGTTALVGVDCLSATSCQAVGGGPSGGVAVAVVSGTPRPTQLIGKTSTLFGVFCPFSTSCWAVGAAFPTGQGVVAEVGPLQGYTPLTPVRICDTRPISAGIPANPCQGAGGTAGTLGKGSITVKVAGLNNVPASASAVVLNVTATGTTDASYLTIWPAGQTQPTASNLNWTAGQTVPNLVEVGLGTGDSSGSVSVYNNAGIADVVIDLEGYVDGAAPGLFNPLAPTRICDSRAAGPSVTANQCEVPGGGAATLGIGQIVVTVAGLAGVPAGATAAVLNVTVTDTTAPGFLTVWPDGASQPLASNLNWRTGQTVPNRVVVPLSANGKIDVYNSAGTTNVVIDVNGYYSTAAGGSGYRRLIPTRLCDTRPVGPGIVLNSCNDPANGTVGPLNPGDELTLTGAPADVAASVFNVTVVNTTASSYLTVFPNPNFVPGMFTQPPLISDLNWVAGQVVANLVVVGSPPAPNGGVTFYNNAGTTDLVVDLEADYAATQFSAAAVASAGRSIKVSVRHAGAKTS